MGHTLQFKTLKSRIAVAVLALIATPSNAQMIATLAGNGMTGSPLNGDSALKAPVGKASTVFLDKAKSFIYTDIINHQIRRVDSNGISTTIAGNLTAGFTGDGGPAFQASLNEPRSAIVNKKKEIVFCDHLNNRVRKIDTLGTITTIAGAGSAAFSGDGGPAIAAEFNIPRGILMDPSGNYFICDEGNNRIRKIDTNGIVTTVMGSASGYAGDGGPATSALLNRPTSISIDKKGQIYITDANNFCVRMIDTLGIARTIAGTGQTSGYGGDGGAPTGAYFEYLAAVSVAGNGDVFIVDAGNNRIRRIKNGVISTIAGTGSPGFSSDGTPPAAASFSVLAGITSNAAGDIIFCDQGNNRIRTFKDPGAVGIRERQISGAQIGSFGQTIYCNVPEPGVLNLFATDGKLLEQFNISAGKNTVYPKSNAGIVIYVFADDQGKTQTGKLLVD